ncbi:MAG: hypothetical protein KDI80_03090 [Xanthomonadales bacterium]|nr:hypothetical protein [Xanthomonadales bacterium]
MWLRARLRVLFGFLALIPAVAGAAPFGVRFFVNTPSVASTASRFPLGAELYDLATGLRVTTNGVNISLNLLRCPGYPSSCSVTVVTSGFASGNTSAGVVNFSNVRIATDNTDYYFSATASGYNTGTSNVFDVDQAVVRFGAIPATPVSTASRFGLVASIRRGTQPADPIDTLASGIPIRLSLLSCLGYPGSCSVSVLNSNFANAVTSSGSATFSSLAVTPSGEDRYFSSATPGYSGINTGTSDVFDVAQGTVRIDTPLSYVFAGVPFVVNASIRAGSLLSDPVDVLADGIPLRLSLVTCPGYPMGCSPSVLNSNFANGVSSNGLVPLAGLVIPTIGSDRYFTTSTPGVSSISFTTSQVFEVVDQADFIFANGFEGP